MTVSARQRAEQLVREIPAECQPGCCVSDSPPDDGRNDLHHIDCVRSDPAVAAIQSAIEEAEREARIRGWTEGRDAAALVLDEVQRVAEKAAAYSRERLDFPARDQHDFRACDAEEAAARIRSLTPPMGQEMP